MEENEKNMEIPEMRRFKMQEKHKKTSDKPEHYKHATMYRKNMRQSRLKLIWSHQKLFCASFSSKSQN